jgi:hypothetical protein
VGDEEIVSLIIPEDSQVFQDSEILSQYKERWERGHSWLKGQKEIVIKELSLKLKEAQSDYADLI